MFPPRPRGPLAPKTLEKQRASMVAHCVQGQVYPAAIVWLPAMDQALVAAVFDGLGWRKAAEIVGVDYRAAMRRWDALHPGQPRPYAKRGPKNGERGALARPPYNAVSFPEVRSHVLHAPDIGAPEP